MDDMHQKRETRIAAGLARRNLLARLGAAGVAGLAARLRAQTAPAKTVIARTTHGQVRGAVEDGVNVFKGIPYAGSPAGAGRFKAPPPLKPWSGVKDALAYGPQAIQPPDPAWPKEWKPAPADEMCLYLNVWTQGVGDRKRRPIMFYSHGGGFATGNGGADVWPQNLSHDGAALARSYDVVVVTHNHRLGILGYLYLGEILGEEYAASGCAGMLDIAAALAWTQKNAEAFGGDPDNIMIWGESGGGAKTSTLLALPSARGTFHKASVESGSTLRLREKAAATESTRMVLEALGLNDRRARELVTVPAETLREIQQKPAPRRAAGTAAISGASMGFSPVVDGHFIPAHPFDPVAPPFSAGIPLITGINKDETIFMYRGTPEVFTMDGAALRRRLEPALGANTDRVLEVYRKSRPGASPADLYIAITTAQWMGMNAIRMAERKVAQKGAPVFMYVFAYESEAPAAAGVSYPTKAAHAAEIPFKFNHPDSMSSTKRPERIKAARNMSRAWATFARTGNPSHDEIPPWPPYTLERRATMFLDAECRVVDDPWREERLLWEALQK